MANVDAAPVRAHIEALLAAGMALEAIHRASGANVRTLRDLLGRDACGPRPTCTARTATRVLAVRPTASRVRVDATGTRRRLEALMALGYSQVALAQELGCYGGNGRSAFLPAGACARSGYRRFTYAYMAVAVRRLYDELSDRPGDPRVAATYRARGYLPPIWWDDDTIDDPSYDPRTVESDRAPDPVAVQRAVMGAPPPTLTRGERQLAVAVLVRDEQLTDELIGARVGASARQVQRDRHDLGLRYAEKESA